MTYYAITNANGPISVRLSGTTAEEATESFTALGDERALIDDPRTEAEDDLGIAGEGMRSSEFAEAMEAKGGQYVADVGDGWELWSV